MRPGQIQLALWRQDQCRRRLIGQILIALGYLSQAQLDLAVRTQLESLSIALARSRARFVRDRQPPAARRCRGGRIAHRHRVLRSELAGQRFVASTSSTTRAGSPHLDAPYAMALDQPGGRVFVADSNLALPIAVDLTTGERTSFSTSGSVALGEPSAVGVTSDGRIYAANGWTTLLQLDASSGARSFLSDDTMPYPELSRGAIARIRSGLGSPLIVIDGGLMLEVDVMSRERFGLLGELRRPAG